MVDLLQIGRGDGMGIPSWLELEISWPFDMLPAYVGVLSSHVAASGILLHVSKCQLDYLIIHLSKWKSSVQYDHYACITPLKTNIEPENHLLEKESHLPNLHLQFPSSFSEGVSVYQNGGLQCDHYACLNISPPQ